MDIFFMILLQLVLIALNAVFACAEIAVLGISETKLAKLVEDGNKRAKRLSRLTRNPARFLSTIQVAITLSGFLGSAFAADNFAEPLARWLTELTEQPDFLQAYEKGALIVITLVLSYITLIFGELVPKRIAQRKAEAVGLGLSGPITFIAKLFFPIVWLLTISTNAVLRMIGIDPNQNDEEVSEEDIRMLVDAGSQKGTIDDDEKEFIQNVFEFDDLTAGEIATHRTEVTFLWLDDPIEQWDTLIHETRHALYPVCHETADDVVGVLNAKDYFRLKSLDRDTIMAEAVRPAYFIPEGVKADVLFRKMKESHNKFAIVLDEYGGMAGIVTINDLVERLVGNFTDDEPKDEEEELPIIALEDGRFKVAGSAPLTDVALALGIPLPEEDYETFGGYVFAELGEIPEDGTTCTVETERLSIEVANVLDHQMDIAFVTVTNPLPTDEDEEDEDA